MLRDDPVSNFVLDFPAVRVPPAPLTDIRKEPSVLERPVKVVTWSRHPDRHALRY
jgi:hypothetical protein